MKASLFLARKYFLSKKKQNFINILSWIGLGGVALGSAALVIVLSVFNGLEGLLRGLFLSFDPDLKIELMEGRDFALEDFPLEVVNRSAGVKGIVPVMQDNALIQYRSNNVVVTLKGVGKEFLDLTRLDRKIVEGNLDLERQGQAAALLGRGVQYKLSIPPNEKFYPMRVLYPKNLKSIRINPEKALNRKDILPTGVFAIEEQFDNNYVLVPLDFAQELFGKQNRSSSMEVFLNDGVNPEEAKAELQKIVPSSFKILTQDEQHLALFRAIKIEKLFVNLAFFFLLLIISFNIFFALSMLVLEKKRDLGMLAALGAGPKIIFRIFLFEGLMIGGAGVVIGLGVASLLGYFQQYHGLVSMGIENAVSDAYPFKMQFMDFLISGIVVFGITALASYKPARSAAKIAKNQVLIIS